MKIVSNSKPTCVFVVIRKIKKLLFLDLSLSQDIISATLMSFTISKFLPDVPSVMSYVIVY